MTSIIRSTYACYEEVQNSENSGRGTDQSNGSRRAGFHVSVVAAVQARRRHIMMRLIVCVAGHETKNIDQPVQTQDSEEEECHGSSLTEPGSH
jgi:hypothetical protein